LVICLCKSLSSCGKLTLGYPKLPVIASLATSDTVEDYLGIPLHIMVKVLEVIFDNELKFKVK
ncbi:hypothetical protein LNN38_27225, partial [Pseudomonas sp. LA21]|uniref:hypothetical protein n=1 Tax=Pseudomonas sp. LA21 TaxID=2893373 RepID=UPI001FB6E99A